MKKLLFIALLATIGATAQTTVTKDANGWATVRGIYNSGTDGIDLNNNGKIKVQDNQGIDLLSSAGNVSINNNLTVNSQGFTTISKTVTTNGIQNTGDITSNGVLRVGAGGANMAIKANGYVEVGQNLYVNGYTFTNQIVATSGAVQFNGATVSGIKAGVAGNDAVNVNQLKTERVQTTQDIAKAKTEAISESKTYTDSKIREVNDKIDLNAETAKLYTDKETTRALDAESKLGKRIDALEFKFDQRINGVLSYVSSEFAAVNNRIEGLGAATVALTAAASSQIYSPNKPTNINIGTGIYGKATAIAVGMSHYFNAQTKLSVNYAAGSNTKNLVGIGVGFGF